MNSSLPSICLTPLRHPLVNIYLEFAAGKTNENWKTDSEIDCS